MENSLFMYYSGIMKTGNNQQQHHNHAKENSRWFSVQGVVAFIIIAIIGYYLLAEHRAHVISLFAAYWWILLFLLCPLMHFMHGGHGGHGDHKDRGKMDDKSSSEKGT